jgi:hypothetical protein
MFDENRDISNADFWKQAGDEYVKKEQFEKAIECYKEAIDINPSYIAAWNNLGFSYFKLGRLDDARNVKNKIKALRENSETHGQAMAFPGNIKDEDQKIDDKPKKASSQPTDGSGKSLINKVPGFRSGKSWKMVLAVIGYGIIFLFILGMIGNAISPHQENAQLTENTALNEAIPTPQYTVQGTSPPRQTSSTQSIDQVKATATTISYEELFRNYQNYIGDTIYFRGQIIQGYSPYSGMYVYRIATDDYGDVLYVNSQSPFLVYDEVDLWGKVKGMKTYTSVLGNSITIPEIDAIQIDLVNKPTPTITRVQKTFTQTPIVTNAPVTRYYNSKFKFSMNYPQNWYKSEEDHSYYDYKATSIEFDSATRDPRVKVTVYATNTNFGSVEKFFTQSFAEIDKNYDITVTKHQSQIDIDGERGYRIDYYIKDENAEIATKVVQVFIVYDEFYYLITYSAPWPRGTEENLYDTYLPTAQEMINSIQFI